MVVFLRMVWMSIIPSARRRVSHAHRRVRILRTMKGARAPLFQRWRWTLVFRLVASLGKYAFTIQNACLFVDCSIENGINSTGEVENSNISFRRGLS